MKTAATSGRAGFPAFSELPTTYTALCGLHLPRPIHTAAEAKAATAVVETMVGHKLNRDQEDYLEAVAHFLDEHDRKTQPALPKASGVAVLKHLLEDRGMTGADLSRLLGGSRTLGPMILRGDRRLTVDHVRTLAKVFGVNPSVLL